LIRLNRLDQVPAAERQETEHNLLGERYLSSAGTFNFNPDATVDIDLEAGEEEGGTRRLIDLRLNQDSQSELQLHLAGVNDNTTTTLSTGQHPMTVDTLQ
jgi:hypothetical protein